MIPILGKIGKGLTLLLKQKCDLFHFTNFLKNWQGVNLSF